MNCRKDLLLGSDIWETNFKGLVSLVKKYEGKVHCICYKVTVVLVRVRCVLVHVLVHVSVHDKEGKANICTHDSFLLFQRKNCPV